ncbi:11698_t:CDS:2, partial [Dentiscutata heterogama]
GQNIDTNVNESGNRLIENSLRRWAIENISTQGISNIAIAVRNATGRLCDVVRILKSRGMQSEMNITNITTNDYYFKRDLLDNLPVSKFYILVELFEPLKHINVVTERNVTDLFVKATNILSEIPQFTFDMEYKTLESFLKFLFLHANISIFGSAFETNKFSFL